MTDSATGEATSEDRATLRAVRQGLVSLHKLLLDRERERFEREHGRIETTHQHLQLVLEHPTFAWLRPLSGLIARFDVQPRQVEIKVEFVTTSNSLDQSFGIDWLFQRGAVLIGSAPGSQARSTDPFFVNFATGGLTTRLRALLRSGAWRPLTDPNTRPSS